MADLTLAVLRRQLAEQKRVDDNVHNLAKAMFQPGAKVQYKVAVGGQWRDYFGECVDVCGVPGTTRVRVRNLSTLKEREIELFQITGLLQEN